MTPDEQLNLPALTARDERNIQKHLESVLNDRMHGEESMSDRDKELIRASLEKSMRLAKQMAKQKFTPKKYRR